jgi:hypothetical protein
MIRTLLIASLAAPTTVGGVALLTTPSAEVKASTPSATRDRPEIQIITHECAQHAWPYYPGVCIRDHRRSSGKASDVRVVFASQLPNAAISNTK